MSHQILAQTPVVNKPFDAAQTIQRWIDHTLDATESLRNLYHVLSAWRQFPAAMPADVFMAILGDLAEAGLLSWADNGGGDSTHPRPALDDLAAALGVQDES